MARERTADSVYLVAWPEGIVKAGYSQRSRWRSFEARGAELLAYWTFVSYRGAFVAERILMRTLIALGGVAAFSDSDAAEPYLGGRGAGWKECYRYAPAMLGAVAEHCYRALPDRDASSKARTDGRTDGLTENLLTLRNAMINLRTAHACTKFDLIWSRS